MLHVYMCGGECCSYQVIGGCVWVSSTPHSLDQQGLFQSCSHSGFLFTGRFIFSCMQLLGLGSLFYYIIFCQSLSTHGLVWDFYFVALGTSWLVSGRVHCVWFSTRSPEGTRICSRPHCQHCDRRYICTTSVSVSSVNAFLMLQCFLCMQLRCSSWCHLRHIGPFAQPHQLAQHRAVRRRQFISQLLQRTRTQIRSRLLTPADS